MTPDDLGWGAPCPQAKIVAFSAGGITLTAHRDAAPIFGAFIEDIVSRGYPVAGAVRDDWGYNCRRIAGSNSWSWHAWGLAIDLNALKNPMGPSLITDMPAWIDEVAAKYGIFWGGNFNGRKDAMHFELHLTPQAAAKVRERIEEDELNDGDKKWIEQQFSKWSRYVARWVDHGEESEPGTGNHHERIREELRDFKTEVNTRLAAIEGKLPTV
jgi:D-alanyl-D-alanine carboxypeptidase